MTALLEMSRIEQMLLQSYCSILLDHWQIIQAIHLQGIHYISFSQQNDTQTFKSEVCVPKQISFSAHYFTLNQFLSSVNYTLWMFLKRIQFLDLISFTLILATIICHLDGSENGITDAMNMNLGKLWGMVRDREAWRAAVHGVTRSWTRLDN